MFQRLSSASWTRPHGGGNGRRDILARDTSDHDAVVAVVIASSTIAIAVRSGEESVARATGDQLALGHELIETSSRGRAPLNYVIGTRHYVARWGKVEISGSVGDVKHS